MHFAFWTFFITSATQTSKAVKFDTIVQLWPFLNKICVWESLRKVDVRERKRERGGEREVCVCVCVCVCVSTIPDQKNRFSSPFKPTHTWTPPLSLFSSLHRKVYVEFHMCFGDSNYLQVPIGDNKIEN